MTNDEIEQKAKETIGEFSPISILSVENVNHRPHPYTIGPAHISYASDHHSGMLGEDTCRKVRCAHPNCYLPYEEHTSDKVIFVQLTKDCTNAQMQISLKKIIDNLPEKCFDGFTFVESKEKYRIKD